MAIKYKGSQYEVGENLDTWPELIHWIFHARQPVAILSPKLAESSIHGWTHVRTLPLRSVHRLIGENRIRKVVKQGGQ